MKNKKILMILSSCTFISAGGIFGFSKLENSASVFFEDKNDNSAQTENSPENYFELSQSNYPLHQDVVTTIFWVGEKAGDDNGDISNKASAWDGNWKSNFGGEDSPKNRNGFYPKDFTPKENPFYFALPYNDFDEDGNRKKEALALIPWAKEKKSDEWKVDESMCKNRWIKIIKNDKIAYAQWEDVGPFGEDDGAYVFGNAIPQSKKNNHAGLDVSPAVGDFLGLNGKETASWQFINEKDVPDGPWKKIITTSQLSE